MELVGAWSCRAGVELEFRTHWCVTQRVLFLVLTQQVLLPNLLLFPSPSPHPQSTPPPCPQTQQHTQVQRTCEALDRQGFTDITTLELLTAATCPPNPLTWTLEGVAGWFSGCCRCPTEYACACCPPP